MTEPTELFVRQDVREFLDLLAANPRPEFNDELVALMRQIPAENLPPSLDAPVGELGKVLNVKMQGPDSALALRLFDVREQRKPGPVVVFFHGGGFIVGSIDTHAGLAAEISRALDLPVVSVEYRLAPEHKWPAAPDDAEAATRWIAENAAVFGREFTHLVICGDSAGGTLGAIVTLALREKPAMLPVVFQLLFYPKADSSRSYPSFAQFADGYALESANMAYLDQAYQPDSLHWRHSPIVADQLGAPPTFVVTAALDPLRDEGRAYAAKLVEAGVEVAYREASGTVHGFATYRRVIPSAKRETSAVLAIARTLIEQALEVDRRDKMQVPTGALK